MTAADARRWLDRLAPKLEERRKDIELPDDYYEGNHRLEYASDKFRQTFGGQFDAFSDNWCAIVADAPDERLGVVGFRWGDTPEADEDANRFWQANQLDARSRIGHLEGIVSSEFAVTVWPNDQTGIPSIDIEHPSQVIVATDPANPHRRLAALKMWTDEWTDEQLATVYLPDGLYKFRKAKRTSSVLTVIRRPGNDGPEWEPREVDGEDWPLVNPMGAVNVVPFPNRQRLLKPPRSEIADVIPPQNAVNKLIADLLVASELGAMPGRWVAGWAEEFDDETNQKIAKKITDYLNRWLVLEEPNAKVGTFEVMNLDPLVKAVEMFVLHIAAQSRTPRHYLIQQGQSPSGDALIAAESGLVAKVLAKQFTWGEAWEEVIRLAFAAVGDQRAQVLEAETMWKDAESRTPAQHMDAVIKKLALRVPIEQLWEDAGYTPPQIRRFKRMLAQEDLMASIGVDRNNADDVVELPQRVEQDAAA